MNILLTQVADYQDWFGLWTNEVETILKHKHLSAINEDQVIDFLENWGSYPENIITETMIKNINWPYISMSRLLRAVCSLCFMENN